MLSKYKYDDGRKYKKGSPIVPLYYCPTPPYCKEQTADVLWPSQQGEYLGNRFSPDEVGDDKNIYDDQ